MQTNTLAAQLAELAEPFDLDTGVACLDFINTLRGRRDDSLREYINSYSDLITFSIQTGELDDDIAAGLAALSAAHPDDAGAALQEALVLREALYAIFSAVAAESPPPQDALDTLSTALRIASAQLELVVEDGEFVQRYCDDNHLHRPLWPLARAAADLFLTPERERIRECANEQCGWIFLDTSRNRSRRWCSMSSCGNRAKVRSFRERTTST